MKKAEEAFKGIRILDFTQVIAGSYGTTIMGDMGAEIIKIEPPGSGDTLRFAGPMFSGESGFFLLNNRIRLGEHNREILSGLLGYSEGKITKLLDNNILYQKTKL